MRKCIFGFFVYIFVTVPSYSNPTIHKIWIGEDLEYLSLVKKNIYFNYCCGITLSNCKLIYNDTAFTIRGYFWKAGKIARQHIDYTYKILKLTNDTLVISPKNKDAARLINNRQTHTFTDKNILYKENLKFQKLFFASFSGKLSSTNIKLEIDFSGQIYFFSETISFFERPNDLKGTYKGQLNEKQLANLIEILKRSELDRFPTYLGYSIDATTYDFKFYYDNKIKESNGCHVPEISRPLLDYLLTIYKNIKLEKIDDNYEFNQF